MYFDLIGALFSSCAFSWEPKNARGEDLVYVKSADFGSEKKNYEIS